MMTQSCGQFPSSDEGCLRRLRDQSSRELTRTIIFVDDIALSEGGSREPCEIVLSRNGCAFDGRLADGQDQRHLSSSRDC